MKCDRPCVYILFLFKNKRVIDMQSLHNFLSRKETRSGIMLYAAVSDGPIIVKISDYPKKRHNIDWSRAALSMANLNYCNFIFLKKSVTM